jgi:lipid II isoglutaminyl synthase (glutamine-hydrolysing)
MLAGAKLVLARGVRVVSRRTGRGGTTAPGRVLLKLEPDALRRLGSRLEGGSVLVSATNGKTTTSAMIASILERAGRRVVGNRAGSNMHWGVATALLDAGRRPGELGLFEVDEAWLTAVARALDPGTLLLSNLFRDQLDRYGELELLADRWEELVAERAGRSTFVLNADDPLVADLGRERERIVYFGVEDDSLALPELQHAADSKHCRRCGHPYEYEAVYLAHLGRYRCPNCGRERPRPEVAAERVRLHGMRGSSVELRTPRGGIALELPLPGLYNVYNAVAATAAALSLGAGLDHVRSGLEAFGGAFGRVETIPIEGRVDPAREEPRRRERGAAHAHPGAWCARPLARVERQHRRWA